MMEKVLKLKFVIWLVVLVIICKRILERIMEYFLKKCYIFSVFDGIDDVILWKKFLFFLIFKAILKI